MCITETLKVVVISVFGYVGGYVCYRDTEGSGYVNTKLVLDEMGIVSASEGDCRHVKYICETVSTRAANLVSCGQSTQYLSATFYISV